MKLQVMKVLSRPRIFTSFPILPFDAHIDLALVYPFFALLFLDVFSSFYINHALVYYPTHSFCSASLGSCVGSVQAHV
jgi:hypothetical protein